jgi:hypothetical protein
MIDGSNIIIRKATKDDISLINAMAKKIWPVTYRAILSPEQLAYMLGLLYSRTLCKNSLTAATIF